MTNWTCPLKLDKATKVIQNKNKRLLSIKVGNRPLGTRADHLWGVFRSSWCDDLLFQKLMHRFSSGFQTRENCWNHEAAGWVFLLFYCFRIASQSRPKNKRKWKIDEFFTRRQVCCYEKLYCYSDLSFQTQRVLVKLVIRRVLLIILWPLPTLRTVK